MYIGFYLNAATTKPGVGLQIYLILFYNRKYAFKQTNKQTNHYKSSLLTSKLVERFYNNNRIQE